MRYLKVIFLACLGFQWSASQSYTCTLEKDEEVEYCVFHDVNYFKNTTSISFTYPLDARPVNVVFKNSNMVGIPRQFVDVFEHDLKILKVENSNLRSVTITRNMESLHARNNVIDNVLTHQSNECVHLKNLDLSSNRLQTIQNLTRCENLRVLDLSGNERLWPSNTVDFSEFATLKQLEELNLSDNGIFYLDNTKYVGLPFLKQLDLSKNNLIPSDLRIDVLKPFVALETLKLNDNDMAQLSYAHLTQLKALKSVYLNGNNFPCKKVKDMLNFLNNDHNIATPLDRHSNCGDKMYEEMCCQGEIPYRPPMRPQPSDPIEDDHTEDYREATSSERTTTPGDDSSSSWQIVLAVIVIIAIVAAGAGYIVYRKRSNVAHQNHD